MVNYEDLPLFPLHVVLFPDMPLSLHIFEPRYREMILRCREQKSPFGIVLLESGSETGARTQANAIGTTARISQYEELPDGRMNILVFGETRFQVTQTSEHQPYLSAQVEPFWEEASEVETVQPAAETTGDLFRTYLRALFAMSGRSLSTLQLPQDPEYLSYAVASVLQVPLFEKQALLTMTSTAERLEREVEILREELEAQETFQAIVEANSEAESLILPVDTYELGKMASLN
jgi:Lon protease-like protein